MAGPLLMKLQSFVEFDEGDRTALEALSLTPESRRAGYNLVREGDRPENVFLLLEGWACRYKLTRDGARQITAYLLPGDLCDPHVFILDRMDHSIGLLSDARVAVIPKERILALTDSRPAVARAFWWSSLVDEATLRQWLLNIGQLDAYERLAHLFCELWLRLCEVGQTRGDSFSLPVTQEQLGDTVGLTSVHVNRTLQQMRATGLIELRDRRITILDPERMKRVADFDPNYRHLQRRGDAE